MRCFCRVPLQWISYASDLATSMFAEPAKTVRAESLSHINNAHDSRVLRSAPQEHGVSPAERVLALQQAIGNRATARLLKRVDRTTKFGVASRRVALWGAALSDGGMSSFIEQPTSESGLQESGPMNGGSGESLQGTVPPPDPDKPYTSEAGPCGDATPAAGQKKVQVSADVALSLSSQSGCACGKDGNADAVSGGIDLSVNINQGKPPGFSPIEFGRTFWFFSQDAVNWREPSNSNTVFFSVPLNLGIDWAVQSRGRTDVSDAKDAAVTASTYSDIIKDLAPTPPSFSPQRDRFWSQRLTIAHELFHVNDYVGKARELVGNTNNWLNSQTIESPVTTEKVAALVDRGVDKIKRGEKDYMNHGDAEERAYLDGKPKYESLVSDIKVRAKSEGWP